MLRSLLELDARLSDRMRVAERPGLLKTVAAFLAHSGDSWFWAAGLILGMIGPQSFLGRRLQSLSEWLQVGQGTAYLAACVVVSWWSMTKSSLLPRTLIMI